ncbi:helix-turn-helix domain-containing protein [Sphingomonas sp. KC8]|uniref:helix-turn-helix domain-containing protein n=1 Tax=Sphingomonas sp. KC8 TaxID=1030157 RepID=UPI000248B204|nr:AraC family transcriptional regulator [Sphingomonas sp. KC8]ARS28361.1 hypothetical protein KC8_13840 [Sphingomonas sp. KC8]
MARHIAQVAPRRASQALLRAVLEQVEAIDSRAAETISRLHLGAELAEITRSDRPAPISDDAFAGAYYAGMTILLDRNAAREGKASMTKAEYDLLCHCVITCDTLGQVIERTQAFMHALACRSARMSLVVEDGIADFRISTDYAVRDTIGLLTDIAGLAAFFRLFGWLIDTPVELVDVRMCYPPLLDSAAASFLIPFPLTYNDETNALRFQADLLDRPVVRTPQQLNTLLARFPFDVNDTRLARDTLRNRVRSFMAATLSKPEKLPTEQQIADRLGISLSTLKRRLKSENASYRAIRDELLCTIAIESLKSERYSVSVLAGRLGFSDISSFRHAFKRWTGQSPGRIGPSAGTQV